MRKKLSSDSIYNLVSLGLAACLIASPFLYGAKAHMPASADAWIIGFVVAYGSAAGMFETSEWPKWVGLIGGLWLAISPWVMGFETTIASAMRADVLLGAALAIVSIVQLWNLHHTPPHISTHA